MTSDSSIGKSFDEGQFEHAIVRMQIEGVTVEIVPQDEVPQAADRQWVRGVIHVISASNPGFRDSDEHNERQHTHMYAQLRGLGVEPDPATGGSHDGDWEEASWVVAGLSREKICELGREFGQVAIFEIDPGLIRVVRCSDTVVASSRPYRVVEVPAGGS